MKKIAVFGFLIFTTTLLCSVFYSCGGDDPIAPTAKVDVASGSTVSISHKIKVTFSKTMDRTTLKLGGTMSAISDGGIWSKIKLLDDTLTISPKNHWDASVPGTLTIAVSDTDKKAIKEESLTYGISLAITSFQKAVVVIGQPDFVSDNTNQGITEAANTINTAFGGPTYFDGALILADYGNDRVVKFNEIPTTNNQRADIVIGQPDFATTTLGSAADQLHGPVQALVYNDKLLVDEYSNYRLVIFNTVPKTDDASADVVVGQTGFGLSTSGCTATTMNLPQGFYAVDGKLIVTDTSNNRVLIWNTIPTTNGKAADLVLGQSDFTHCAPDDTNQDGVGEFFPSAETMALPVGVWSDGTKLVVVDSTNNRILIWNTFPTKNFQKADIVLGQADFTHNTENDDDQDGVTDSNPSARTLAFPFLGVYSNGTQLFIADESNNRILIWNTFPTKNFQVADLVLGQGDFLHNTANDDDQNGVIDGTSSPKTLNFPVGMLIVGDKLIVSDRGNHRVLIYQGQ